MSITEPKSLAETPLLRANGLRMKFPETLAVDGLSLELAAGCILGLIGPNGCGKTTTLRMLSGILPLGGGSVEIAGFDLEKNPVEAKQRLAFIPCDPQLFDTLTVWEHIRFTAEMYRISEYKEPAGELLNRFDLSAKRNAVCGELSRGMRHKVGICCALLRKPDLLMFDEPLTGLDPKAIRQVKEIITQLAASGTGVIISSHLLPLLENFATTFLILQQGRRRFCGDFAALRELARQQPSNSLEDIFLSVTSEQPPA